MLHGSVDTVPCTCSRPLRGQPTGGSGDSPVQPVIVGGHPGQGEPPLGGGPALPAKVRPGVAAASASAMTRPKGSGRVITAVCRAIPGTGGSDRRPGSTRCDQAGTTLRPAWPGRSEPPGGAGLSALTSSRRLGQAMSVTENVARLDIGSALAPPGRCPGCGSCKLTAVTDGEQTAFLCQSCGQCWQVELGWARPVGRRNPAAGTGPAAPGGLPGAAAAIPPRRQA